MLSVPVVETHEESCRCVCNLFSGDRPVKERRGFRVVYRKIQLVIYSQIEQRNAVYQGAVYVTIAQTTYHHLSTHDSGQTVSGREERWVRRGSIE